ncbi:MAG: endonuclease/exonuclease/phosphatase family protein [Mycobacteriaceae bacterium]
MQGLRVIGKWLIITAGWLGILAVCVAFIARLVPSSHWTLLGLAASWPLFVIGAVIPLVIFALARRWRSFSISLIVFLVACGTQAPLFLRDAPADEPTDIVVMQSNMFFGQANADELMASVREASVDVLTVNELTPEAVQKLTLSGILKILPYHYTAEAASATGTGIWSKYPLSEQTQYPGFALHTLSVRVELPSGQRPLVLAVHPVAPMGEVSTLWASELSRLKKLLISVLPQDIPVIVSGDFNSTYDHKLYRNLLVDGYRDVGEQAGSGVVPTWKQASILSLLFSIDHIIVRGGQGQSFDSIKVSGTDHRAVVGRLAIH